jgi:hypothetical protein
LCPIGIATDPNGTVYVLDACIPNIQRFTGNGTYLMQWGSWGTWTGQFEEPSGIAIDASGHIYVVDGYTARVQIFAPGGAYLAQWGSPGTGNGQFGIPRGVATDVNGDIYVVDEENCRCVQKFGMRSVAGVGWKVEQLALALSTPYPNPFRGRVNLRFRTAMAGAAVVEIYDVLGRKIREWRWPSLPPGRHEVEWDGGDRDGGRVAAGILFCKLSAGGQTFTRKLIHLR